ncbi:transposase [Actinoplanes couchii]
MADRVETIYVLAKFREQFYRCLTRRADALFELTEAVLCTDGPVKTLVGLSLAPEHRGGRGTIYDALNHGRIEVASLRRQLTGNPLPRAAYGRPVLAVDFSPWRPAHLVDRPARRRPAAAGRSHHRDHRRSDPTVRRSPHRRRAVGLPISAGETRQVSAPLRAARRRVPVVPARR